jgi:hypothetical protein
MRVWNVILFAITAGCSFAVLLHYQHHGALNGYQIALASFLWINVIIALWELCLFARIDLIAAQHERLAEQYRGREMARVRDFMLTPVPLAQVLSPTLWAGIWSSYAVFDESYASKRSFGFFVDIGNGFSTLVPSLLFLHGMTFWSLPARAVGIVGLLLFYQMWYGTLIYLVSFVVNKRHVGHPRSHVALLVGMSNGLWLTVPVLGMIASLTMIYRDSYALFGP